MKPNDQKKDFEELSEEFDMIIDAYEQLVEITSKAEDNLSQEVQNNRVLLALNCKLAEWGGEAIRKVRFFEGLSETLLDEMKRRKKEGEETRAA